MSRRSLSTAGFVTLTLACAFLGTGAQSLLAIHAANERQSRIPLPPAREPRRGDRLLIVAPHPDDETLGCSGLMRHAARNGAHVSVVLLTCGDNFPAGVARMTGQWRLHPYQFVEFGKRREGESRRALVALGLGNVHPIFLGYPDGGLISLWMNHWSPNHPLRSSATAANAVCYSDAFDPGAPYCGRALEGDLAAVIAREHPTDIYFTHPNDDHGDHWAAGCFVLAALELLRSRAQPTGSAPAWPTDQLPRLHTYLIHRGDWPVPQGLHASLPLGPPNALSGLDTRWHSLKLTAADVAAKIAAIRQHKTQCALPPEKRFLMSFARSNELFGELPMLLGPGTSPASRLGPGGTDGARLHLASDRLTAGPTTSGAGRRPRVPDASLRQTPWYVVLDPVADKLSRDFEEGADLQRLAARRVGQELQVRVETHGRISRWVTYQVQIHQLDPAQTMGAETCLQMSFCPQSGVVPAGVKVHTHANRVEFDIPMQQLGGAGAIVMSADTRVGSLMVDRTGWRGCLLW